MKINVLIGGAGFIGKNLKKELIYKDEKTIIVDRNSKKYQEIYPDMFGWTWEVDFGDTVHVYVLQSNKIPMYGGRFLSTEDNLEALLDVVSCIKYLKECGCILKVFYASTSDVYGNASNGSERRELDTVSLGDPTSPRWSYGACKIVGEHLFLGLMEEYKIPVIVGRIFSSYGPYGNLEDPWKAGVQQVFIYNAIKGIKTKIHGNGMQTRTYVYIDDLIRAMMMLMNSDSTGVFNLCSNMIPVNMINLLGCVSVVHGSKLDYELIPYEDVHRTKYDDVMNKVGNNRRLIAATGWCEKTSFIEGLKKTYNWVKENV